jgi:hypothetical protein
MIRHRDLMIRHRWEGLSLMLFIGAQIGIDITLMFHIGGW